MYQRKTKDIYAIEGKFYGQKEIVSTYEKSERKQAMEDLREYNASNTGTYRLVLKRVKK